MHYRSHVEQLAAAPFFTTLRRLGADAVAPILVGEIAHADRLHRFAAVVGLSLLDVPAALPRLAQRAFVLAPLADLLPAYLPLLAQLPDQQITRLD